MNLSMLNEARKLKAQMDKAKKELSNITMEVSVGKDAVKITIDGQQRVRAIKISPEVVDSLKVDNLEKLMLKAVNEAIETSQKKAAKHLSGLTAGLKIPGLT